MDHFADRLTAACRARKNSLCVGLDPRWALLPLALRARWPGKTLEAMAAAFEEYCQRVLDIVAPLVPIVKPQSAFFEACGPAGLTALRNVLRHARDLGLITILDGKRNDIASTAEAYADAAFEVWGADSLTVNPYLGRDAVEPFLASARKCGGGVFVLVRTSNKGAKLFQDLQCDGKPLYQHVGEAVGSWAKDNVGQCGLGDVGAVVGATHPAELAALRALLPHVLFLVPGYGAQGGSARDSAAGFRADGTGAIINSSRGIIAAFRPEDGDWEKAVEAATRDTIAALARETAMAELGG